MRAGAASTTRSTAPTRFPRRTAPSAARATTRCAARKVDRLRARLPRRGGAARRRVAGRDATRLRGRRTARSSSRSASGGDDRPARRRRSSPAIAATRPRPTRSCCATTACTSRSLIDRDHRRSARTIRPASPTSWLEAALTTIMDCEDSVAAVDAEDKVARLPQLARPDEGRPHRRVRQGRQDRSRAGSTPTATYTAPDGGDADAARPRLMLVRNVGHLMTNPTRSSTATATRCPKASWTRMVTALIALHDVGPNGRRANQPRRLGLYRQAEDARAGGGRLRRRAVRPRRGRARPAAATR